MFTGDDSSDEQNVTDFLVLLHSTGNTDYIRYDHPPTPRPSRQPDFRPWEPTRPHDKAYFQDRNEAPLPPLRPRCNFIHPRQFSPSPERLKFPFSSDEILSGYEDTVSSGTDQFHDTLVHHMVDVQKATADFREASERRLATGIQDFDAEKKMPSKSRSQASGMSSRYKMQLRLTIVTFLLVGST